MYKSKVQYSLKVLIQNEYISNIMLLLLKISFQHKLEKSPVYTFKSS